jgi:hypothetical protein
VDSKAALLALALACTTANAQYTSSGPPRILRPPIIPPNAKDFTLKGEHVCLRRRPDANGRVQLDCAIGFRGDDDRFYELIAANPTQIVPPEMQLRVRLTGKWIPMIVDDPRYDVAGRIFYVKKEYLYDEPKPITGTFVCLAPVAGAPIEMECRNGIVTDGRMEWGLDRSSFDALPAARTLTVGDRVSLKAEIVRDMPPDWTRWATGDRLEGVLKVRSVKRLPAR